MASFFSLEPLSDDIVFSNLTLLGTHDSATAFPSFARWARCQNLTIEEQLALGVRFLDIRLYELQGSFRLVHSVADCYTDAGKKVLLKFDRVLQAVTVFLQRHPQETVLMSIKLDRGAREASFYSRFYNRYIKGQESLWYLENAMPTLGQVRGKIVLMRRFIRPYCAKGQEPKKDGLDFSVWENQKKPVPAPPFLLGAGAGLTARIQDNYNLGGAEKWEKAVLPFLETERPTDTRFCLNCLSTSGGGETPQESGAYVNAKFLDYPLCPGVPYGYFLADFAEKTLLQKAMEHNLTL